MCSYTLHLHGVEHAHQSCEAEANGKHGLHAHLQADYKQKCETDALSHINTDNADMWFIMCVNSRPLGGSVVFLFLTHMAVCSLY